VPNQLNPTRHSVTPRSYRTARGRRSKSPFLVAFLATSFNRLRRIRGRKPGYATDTHTTGRAASTHRVVVSLAALAFCSLRPFSLLFLR
jgi:hypothetical protein